MVNCEDNGKKTAGVFEKEMFIEDQVDSVEGSNILVVDDDGMNLKVANKMLREKFCVFTAASGIEAFAVLEKEKIDLILLDVHMPEMDGHEVIRRLKGTDIYKNIPVVFLTADSDGETEVQGFLEGAMDFITKPFRKNIVIQRITRILELDYLQKNLQKEVIKQTKKAEERRKKVEQMSLQMVQTLANTIDAKDRYTNGHSIRVAEYAAILAKASGLEKTDIDNVKYAALLHDIGKIGVADSVLNKPGKLTESEYEVIKSHTTIGSEILQNISTISTAELVARHHHERYDGKGYPDGLAGEDIPFEARIVCIADAYDAMNSRRVYRKSLSRERIREEFVNGRGTQFDPVYLDVFLKLFDENELEVKEERAKDPMIAESGLILQKVMETMSQQSSENERDSLTGLMLRKEGDEAISLAMSEEKGCLAFVDIDNLKKINDTIGHIAGDLAIKTAAELLAVDEENTIACRIGGDEFLYYMKGFSIEQAEERIKYIIRRFDEIKEDKISIKQASLSAGICVTNVMDNFEDAKNKADKALYYVKQNGKADYYVYKEHDSGHNSSVKNIDLDKLVKGLEKSGGYEGALDMDYRAFAKIFEFLKNIESRYDYEFKMALITLDTHGDGEIELEHIEKAMGCMEKAIQSTIRNVDVYTRYSSVQYLVIFFDVLEDNVVTVVNRVFQNFYKMYDKNNIELHYDIAQMNSNKQDEQ